MHDPHFALLVPDDKEQNFLDGLYSFEFSEEVNYHNFLWNVYSSDNDLYHIYFRNEWHNNLSIEELELLAIKYNKMKVLL